tara:strand:+ start:145 stop:1737 length:1593 start_codon:yes stop_codon:yes gene_type:complete
MKIYYSNIFPSEVKQDSLILLPDYYEKSSSILWDDFGYKTTFRAFFLINGHQVSLGYIKLLFKDIFNSHQYIKEKFSNSNEMFDLSDIDKHNFISIGEDLDYYKIINSQFQKETKIKSYLKLINDVCFLSSRRDDFQGWAGFDESLLRDSSFNSILSKGLKTALGRYEELSKFELKINQENGHSLKIVFNKEFILPSRINILIGSNGNGKTRTLKYISDIYTGLTRKNDRWAYCNKLIVLSFSPFDQFFTARELIRELNSESGENQAKDLINGYSYIGFKDDISQFNLDSFTKRSVQSYIDAIYLDKTRHTRQDFQRVSLINETLHKAMRFDSIAFKDTEGIIIPIEHYNNSCNIDDTYGLVFLNQDGEEIRLSSGQKMYSLFVPSIISSIKLESLLLIDEPELYLHPELEVGLITMLKEILTATNSFAVIATHSAIIAREVQSDYVHILEHNNKSRSPDIETLGNSLERITADVFDDATTNKPYQKQIDKLLSTRYNNDIDKAIEELSNELGLKAISYLYSKKQKSKND